MSTNMQIELGKHLHISYILYNVISLFQHFDGTRFAHACRSAAFDRSTGKCTVYEAAISPNGDLNYQPNTNSIYFEKYCLPGNYIQRKISYKHNLANVLALTCDDIVHRIPQHTLDKRAIGTGAVITTATQIECIKQCITSKVTMTSNYYYFIVTIY